MLKYSIIIQVKSIGAHTAKKGRFWTSSLIIIARRIAANIGKSSVLRASLPMVSFALLFVAAAAVAPRPQVQVNDEHKPKTHAERMVHMAHVLKNHFSHKANAHKVASDAIDSYSSTGVIDPAKYSLVVTEVSTLLGPAAAAAAGITFTAEDANDFAGESAQDDHQLEEGGSEGENGSIESSVEEGDMAICTTTDHETHLRGATKLYTAGAGKPWTGKKLNYCFATDTAQAVKDVMARAVTQFKKVLPCLEMEDVGYSGSGEVCNTSPAVYITSANSGCWSYVGELSSWSSQGLNLQSPGCDSLGTTMHELLHALGQKHEQSRPDRDTYVTVDFTNIQSGKENNFVVSSAADVGRAYDMLSLMHYSAEAFSINGGPTITPKPAAYGLYTTDPAEYHKYELGNRLGMTQLDANQLAEQYSCTANVLEGVGPCTDKLAADGSPWADTYGNNCNFYRNYGVVNTTCQSYVSNSYCCGCGGGIQEQQWASPGSPGVVLTPPPPPAVLPPTPTPSAAGECTNTNGAATDPYGDGCSAYAASPSWCGGYDDLDFNSNQMCCACGGGATDATGPATSPVPSPSPSSPPPSPSPSPPPPSPSPSPPPPSPSNGTCQNTNGAATDPYGDGCIQYNSHPNWCGGYNSATFNSDEMCCICGGGEGAPPPSAAPATTCHNTNGAATDPYGDGCVAYASHVYWCGGYNSATFNSDTMCCACGGGEDTPLAATSQRYVKAAAMTVPNPHDDAKVRDRKAKDLAKNKDRKKDAALRKRAEVRARSLRKEDKKGRTHATLEARRME